ncbi:copper resistance protein CopC [Microbacteriaceae bacterium VKM Ac-2854]|nr:copper resistance protein CopC [Microbacteriaceae bacterium VKM Ac-2854]
MTRRLPFAVAVVAGVGLALAAAVPAQAHNYLVSSTPTAGDTVTEQPATVSVTTNDNLLNLGDDGTAAAIQVVGPDGLYYGDGCTTVLGPTASMPAELGAAGEYTVTWQVVSTDGHPVSDQFSFDWQPAQGQTVGEGSATAPDCNGTVSVQTAVPSEESPSGTAEPALLGDVLWIGGGLLAVVVAVGVTLLILRRKR